MFVAIFAGGMLLLAVAGASWPRQKTPIPAANIMLHSSIAPPPIVKPMRKSALIANVCATAVGHKSLLLSGLSAEADLASLAALTLGTDKQCDHRRRPAISPSCKSAGRTT